MTSTRRGDFLYDIQEVAARHTGLMTLVDLYAAQLATGIPAYVLRKRLSRGTLTRHGYDRRRRALIDLNELTNPAPAEAA